MTLLDAYKVCIKKYAVFEGRAGRKEYWYFCLFNFLIMVVLGIPALLFYYSQNNTAFSIFLSLMVLYELFVFLPSLAVTVRRLHDGGRSGAWVLILLIPTVGQVLMLIWTIEEGNNGPNQYGPKPNDTQGLTPPVHVTCISGSIAGRRVSGTKIYIGRDYRRCQLVFPEEEPGVSRRHCVVRSNNNVIELIDLNSSNGTFLSNGSRLTPNVAYILKTGTRFYVGKPVNMFTVSID